MLSVTDLVCNYKAGNEALRYGHVRPRGAAVKHEDKFGSAPRPVTVWAVTRACNLRCTHCYASADSKPANGELSYHEGIELLNDLRDFNVPAVLFSGGEPLSRPDCTDLISYARSIGLRCTLSTNGLLIDEPMADRLAEIGLQYIGISLDGSPAKHDKLRGQAGAFAGSLAAIDRCKARGIKVGVRFTVHALNCDDLDSIFDICLEHGVDRLCVYHLAYAGRGDKMKKVDLTHLQTRGVVDRIVERSKTAHRDGRKLEVLTVGNHADAAYLVLSLEKSDPEHAKALEARLQGTGGNQSGNYIASIDSIGNVHYDQFSWHYPCGNVRQAPFSQIWGGATDSRLSILRNRKSYLPERCQACRFLSVCNGNLRTRAESATGDWLGADPACYLEDAEIQPVG